MHLSHLNSSLAWGLHLLNSLDGGHHIGVGVGVGVGIGVCVRDGIGGRDIDLLEGGGEDVVVGEGVVCHVVVWKGVVHSDRGHRGSDDLGHLVDRGGGLHGLEAAGLNVPEAGHKSLLGLGNIHGVIKIGVGDLGSLDVMFGRHHVDVVSGLDCLVDSGEGFLGGLDLGGVLEGK